MKSMGKNLWSRNTFFTFISDDDGPDLSTENLLLIFWMDRNNFGLEWNVLFILEYAFTVWSVSCSLILRNTHFLAGTRCRQPVCAPAQCPSERERKELLIILDTTGGRHAPAFLWEPLVTGTGRVWRYHMPQAFYCLFTGFAVYHKVSECPTLHPNACQQPPIWTISRDFRDTNKQGKDVEGEDICMCIVTPCFSTQAQGWGTFPEESLWYEQSSAEGLIYS